jgi:hypothetical protein
LTGSHRKPICEDARATPSLSLISFAGSSGVLNSALSLKSEF